MKKRYSLRRMLVVPVWICMALGSPFRFPFGRVILSFQFSATSTSTVNVRLRLLPRNYLRALAVCVGLLWRPLSRGQSSKGSIGGMGLRRGQSACGLGPHSRYVISFIIFDFFKLLYTQVYAVIATEPDWYHITSSTTAQCYGS